MTKTPDAFQPEVAETILTFLEAGAFEDVAAEAAGLPRETFHRWLARGTGRRAVEPYRSFARRVHKARATARAWAEVHVRQHDPRTWLKCGPGRERSGQPGWTREVAAADADAGSLLTHPDWPALWDAVRRALAGFPEARQAVALALYQQEARPRRPGAATTPTDPVDPPEA